MNDANSNISHILTYLDINEPLAERKRREALVNDILPDRNRDHLAKVYDSRLAARLGEFVHPYRHSFYTALVLMLFGVAANIAIPRIIGQAIDDGMELGDVTSLRFWTAMFVIAVLTNYLFSRIRIRILATVGTRIVADIRAAMFRHLHSLTLNFHTNYSVGRLMSRLIGDVGVLRDFVTWSITGVVRAAFMLVGISLSMLLINWQLALVAFVVMPILAMIANYWRKHARRAYMRTRAILSHINGYLNESISGIRVTKSFTRENENIRHFDDLNQTHFEKMMGAEFLSATFFPAIQFFSYLTTAIIVVVGGQIVLGDSGSLDKGELVTFVLYIGRFFDPIRELARRLSTFQATMASSERIFRLLDTEPDINDAPNAVALTDIKGRVVFDEVAFHYKEDEPVLRGVSISAEPGERIALVGETGAGKSTIIRLLSRFYEVSDGSITIDGHDLRHIKRSTLRQRLGIVLQDSFLFSGTLMENIRYGRLEASDEEVIAAATAVGAHAFIERMEKGYQTNIGENGVNLSVGQRQIISFARALLADPRILILDEATSSVDTATEKLIEQAVDTLMKGRTSFVIAHRLSTIVNSDKIVVIDQGQIIEMGSHEELLAQKGRYYNLYTMQWASQTVAK
ncbi:MAG: ABC transporter ATP-binding protein [Candidatus Promineifilaceae bacterium]